MKKEIVMPKLGESVTEGTITKWFVKEGDRVNKYEPIAEVMTDKVSAEVPSSYAGVIKQLVAKEDAVVQVGGLMCYIDVRGEITNDKESKDEIDIKTDSQTMKNRYSPAVLRRAQEHEIDLTQISGTGRGGRITRKDIEKIIANGQVGKNERTKPTYQTKPQERATSEQGDKTIPLSPIRQAIAKNMKKSKEEIPHAWTMVEVDVTNLVTLRNKMKDRFQTDEGFSLTYLPFFIKTTAETLKEYPQLNATWDENAIIQRKDVNISIAVATEDALYVPVIKQADEKSLIGLARSIHDLRQKVDSNTIGSDEMTGGTFTINNTGTFGSIQSMPIINYPQAAILSVESIVKRPVVMEGDMIAIRHMVNLCLSIDHRVLDGLIAGKFLARLKEKLESIDSHQLQW